MKITVEYDTASKQITVTQDGSALTDVDSISFNRKYDYVDDKYQPVDPAEYSFGVCTSKKMADDDAVTVTQTYAQVEEQRNKFLASLLKQKRIK